jgi:hypothetical protein
MVILGSLQPPCATISLALCWTAGSSFITIIYVGADYTSNEFNSATQDDFHPNSPATHFGHDVVSHLHQFNDTEG